MMKMIYIPIIFLTVFGSSFYEITLHDIGGNRLDMNEFKGKKILIVNIAGNSPGAVQLTSLRKLKDRLQDSLVILLVPSNSFRNEPRGENKIRNDLKKLSRSGIIITEKMDVAGTHQAPLYQWITRRAQNKTIDLIINSDFNKFLISGDGQLIGIFPRATNPFTNEFITAIKEAM